MRWYEFKSKNFNVGTYLPTFMLKKCFISDLEVTENVKVNLKCFVTNLKNFFYSLTFKS